MAVLKKRYTQVNTKLPADLKEKIDSLKAEYLRQGVELNINATIVALLEREVKRMERDVRKKNPDYEHKQQELSL